MTQEAAFDGAAYANFRLAYPRALFDEIVGNYSLSPATHKLLDVGAGTGQLAIPFAERGFHVVALEPGERQVTFLEICTRNAKVDKRVRIERGAGEELAQHVGTGEVHIAMFGNSLHWVDGARTLAACDTCVARDGGVVVVDSRKPLKREPWHGVFDAIVERYQAERYRSPAVPPHADVLAASPFPRVRKWRKALLFEHTSAQLAGLACSLSGCSLEVLGDRQHALRDEMQRSLDEQFPGDRHAERIELVAWFARRPVQRGVSR